MKASYCDNYGFPSIHIECLASELLETLQTITSKYDDGQGRAYDILDSEYQQIDNEFFGI